MLLNNTLSWLIQRTETVTNEPCQLCDDTTADSKLLCAACFQDLPRYDDRCEICAIPLPQKANKKMSKICGQCLAQQPAFDRVYSPFLYQPPLSSLIHQLKYQQQLHTLRLLGDLISDYLQEHLEITPDVIVPVPLHRKRIRERGFNQASELAFRISHRFGVPVDNRLIKRNKHTQAQTGLKPGQRKSNIAGAFSLSGKAVPKRILIIDDVLTTGATAAEMSKCLKRRGAETVEIATLARADRH